MTFDTAKVDSNDAREASMSRVQTQETVLASLVTPASVEAAKTSQDMKPDDKPGEGDQKPKKTAQDRIVELVHKNRDASAKAAEAEDRVQRLEAEMQMLRTQAKPIQVTDEPQREQFDSDAKFNRSLAEWLARGIVAERDQQQSEAQMMAEQAEIAAHWDKRQQQAISGISDYAEVIGASDIQIPKHVHDEILESEQGPEIAYYLALHPEEAKRIASMSEKAAIRRITNLGRDLSGLEIDAAPKKPVSESPKKSRAPEPITPVRGIAAANTGPTTDYAEYRRRRLNK